MTGIIYGSSTGSTEEAARKIHGYLGADSEVLEVSTLRSADFERFDRLLLGSSTWGAGDLQDDWVDAVTELEKADLKGKKVGFFGFGDQEMFSSSFVDALGILYHIVKNKGVEVVGRWPSESYDFESSEALIDGSFIGLALDGDNQSQLTDHRIEEWVGLLD